MVQPPALLTLRVLATVSLRKHSCCCLVEGGVEVGGSSFGIAAGQVCYSLELGQHGWLLQLLGVGGKEAFGEA
jgi:hypothetical protein